MQTLQGCIPQYGKFGFWATFRAIAEVSVFCDCLMSLVDLSDADISQNTRIRQNEDRQKRVELSPN